MTYYNAPAKQQNVIVVIIDSTAMNDSTAMSREAEAIKDNTSDTIQHYLDPYSRIWDSPELRFQMLKEDWVADIKYTSSTDDIAMHPSYQQIIGMGPVAVPLILSELQREPGHWFWALKSITGEDPIAAVNRGNMNKMAQSWIEWGRTHNLLNE